MKAITLKEFVAENNFVQIAPTVRVNTTGYPYLTFINGKNEAENVYFSKKAAVGVAPGQPVTKDMLSGYQVGFTTNAEGEERIKIISNSERLDLADLL